MNTAQLLIKSLAENPSEAINRFKDYEKIILNFSQLIYWMRPLQALLEVKSRLVAQTETKEKLRSELISMLHQLKIDLNSVINL
jgi:MED7 protein